MNRKAFIQDKSAMFLLHPQIAAMGKSDRLDAAINLAEALWERLKDRGYGPTTATSERSSRNWYAELQDQEEFDKCWFKYGKQGSRDKAAKAWIEIPESEKAKVFPAIPRYLEDIRCSGTAKAHFSTWLNEQRWLNYEKTEEKKQSSPAYNEKAQRISGLRHQISLMRDDNPMKAELQSQLDRLINDG